MECPPCCKCTTWETLQKFISDNDTDLFAMLETWIRPCRKSPHQVTVCINSHKWPAVVEDWGFSLKMDWMYPLFLQRPAPPSKTSSSRYP